MLLITSIRKSSFLSKQSILIVIGTIVPIAVNVIGMTILEGNIYTTPISFIVTIILFRIAILRYNFLNIAPIALKRVVNQMSDSYMILNQDYIVSDCNKPFEHTFKTNRDMLIGEYIFDLNISDVISSNRDKFKDFMLKAQKSEKIFKLEASMKNEEKFFNIEISGIFEDKQCIGILLLFKDITQHVLDMRNLEKNQNILIERERLASLGQMVGGIAHNLKTPIMSIAGAADGLEDLIKEYDKSIDDPEVTKEDHHEIVGNLMGGNGCGPGSADAQGNDGEHQKFRDHGYAYGQADPGKFLHLLASRSRKGGKEPVKTIAGTFLDIEKKEDEGKGHADACGQAAASDIHGRQPQLAKHEAVIEANVDKDNDDGNDRCGNNILLPVAIKAHTYRHA